MAALLHTLAFDVVPAGGDEFAMHGPDFFVCLSANHPLLQAAEVVPLQEIRPSGSDVTAVPLHVSETLFMRFAEPDDAAKALQFGHQQPLPGRLSQVAVALADDGCAVVVAQIFDIRWVRPIGDIAKYRVPILP